MRFIYFYHYLSVTNYLCYQTTCYRLFQCLKKIPCWKPLVISFCSSLGSTLLLIKRTTIDPYTSGSSIRLLVALWHVITCISSAFFSKLASVRVSQFSPLSVLASDTLTCTRCTSQTLFHEREKNVLGMGRDFSSGLDISSVDLLSNFVPFGGPLMPQRLTALTETSPPFASQPPSRTAH